MRSFTITPSPIQGERWHHVLVLDDGTSICSGQGWSDQAPERTRKYTPEKLLASGYIEE